MKTYNEMSDLELHMARTIVSIRDAQWVATTDLNPAITLNAPLSDYHALVSFMSLFRGNEIFCSSTVDFPEEYGAPATFDARTFLGRAIAEAEAK